MKSIENERFIEINVVREVISNFCLLVFLGIITLIGSILSIVTLCFFMGVPASSWQIIVSFLLMSSFLFFACRFYFNNNKYRYYIAILFVIVLLIIVAMFISGSFLDLSYDGQAYHQEAIIQLEQGWNPVFQRVNLDQNEIWINHYAKASEILGATLYKFTNNIEYGKCFNLLLIFASFFISFSVLLQFARIKILFAFILGIILAFNPVSICQSLSFYVDGQMASLIISLCAIFVLVFTNSDFYRLAGLASILIVLLNIKFSAVVYASYFVTAFIFALFLYRKSKTIKQVIFFSLISFMFGILIVGYNPYITNTIKKGHPFYPLFGHGSIDIMTSNTPEELLMMNRMERLFFSLFSQSENYVGNTSSLKLKIPFTIHLKELDTFTLTDTRIGGFGPLFGGIVLLTLLLMVILIVSKSGKHLICSLPVYIILVLFTSCIIIADAWWARYVPQLWIIPVVEITILLVQKSRLYRYGAIAAVFLLITNIFLVSKVYFVSNYNKTLAQKAQFIEIAKQNKPVEVYFGPFGSNRIRLNKYGIKYKEVKSEKELAKYPNVISIHFSTTKIAINNQE